jgi:PDZ domain
VQYLEINGRPSKISRGATISGAVFGTFGNTRENGRWDPSVPYGECPNPAIGAFDAKGRIERLDKEGLKAAVIYPTLALQWETECDDADYAQAMCRAYNRAVLDWCAEGNDKRLFAAAHLSLGDRANAGIGFAIPVDLAKPVMAQLREYGRVIRGWLGVDIQAMTPRLAKAFDIKERTGALVANVRDGSPAARAGIKREDVILTFNGRRVRDEHELPQMVAQTPISSTVPIEVLRNKKLLTLHAKIGELQEREVASAQHGGLGTPKFGLVGPDFNSKCLRYPKSSKTQGFNCMPVSPASARRAYN